MRKFFFTLTLALAVAINILAGEHITVIISLDG